MGLSECAWDPAAAAPSVSGETELGCLYIYLVIYTDWKITTTQGRNDPQKILFAAFQVFDFAGMVESVEAEVTVSGRPPPTRTST